MSEAARNVEVLYGPNFGSKNKRIRIKKFCIDDDAERTEYENLLGKMMTKEIKVLSEESIFSQRDGQFYIVMKWQE